MRDYARRAQNAALGRKMEDLSSDDVFRLAIERALAIRVHSWLAELSETLTMNPIFSNARTAAR